MSEFETSLIQVPLAAHLKVPPGLLTVPAILQPLQVKSSFSLGILFFFFLLLRIDYFFFHIFFIVWVTCFLWCEYLS